MDYQIKSTETLFDTLDILMGIAATNAFNVNSLKHCDLNIYIKMQDRLMAEDDC